MISSNNHRLLIILCLALSGTLFGAPPPGKGPNKGKATVEATEDTGAQKKPEVIEDGNQKEERGKPSWIERLFGIGDKKKEQEPEREEVAAEKKAEKKTRDEKTFSKEEREVLEGWQRGEASWKKSGKKLPPGLQKKVDRGGELPPGWKKKLNAGERLPEELEAQSSRLPEEILKRLPESPENTEILQIGDDIIRVMESSREIIDILGTGSTAE